MLKKNLLIALLCLFASFKSMAELNPQANENVHQTDDGFSELEEKIIATGAGVGFLIAGPTAAIAAIAMSLPVAGLSMIALPLYYLTEGEKAKALEGLYAGPLSVMGLSGASALLIGGIMTGAVTGMLTGSGLRIIKITRDAITGRWNREVIAIQ